MITVWIYSLVSVLIVSLISFIGIFTFPIKGNKLKNMLLYFVSFSVGALLGDVFIHLLPEVVKDVGFSLNISAYILFGIITSFIIEKILHWRHSQTAKVNAHHRPFATMNLLGDGIHNFIDGLIIGASYLAGFSVGIGSTIAVLLHEIPQEIGDYGVLIHGGFTKNKALFFNFLTALTAIIGVAISLFLSSSVGNMTTFLLPFAAGNFIYIAGSDLIPELHKEVSLKRNILQFIALISGVAVMALLLLLG